MVDSDIAGLVSEIPYHGPEWTQTVWDGVINVFLELSGVERRQI